MAGLKIALSGLLSGSLLVVCLATAHQKVLAQPSSVERSGGSLGDMVDPFVGTEGGTPNGGNTAPGASVPFGFVLFSPDTTQGDSNGYDQNGHIMGFSYTHLSGTGGYGKYGNFRVTPTIGDVHVNNLAFRRANEQAAPGYYAVDTVDSADRSIRTELTASRLTGFSQFTFQSKTGSRNLILDLTSGIPYYGRGQRATGAHADIHPDNSMSGWASFEGGITKYPYKIFFYAKFDQAVVKSGTWQSWMGGERVLTGAKTISGGDQRKEFLNCESACNIDPVRG